MEGEDPNRMGIADDHMKPMQFIKDWTLVLAMIAGVVGYFACVNICPPGPARTVILESVSLAQPLLIFAMLFLTFCKVDLHHLRFRKWHLWLLMIQCGVFLFLGFGVMYLPQGNLRVILEGAMLCMICPTATAGAVVTRKLGGNVGDITTYTILINLAVSLLIPVVVPMVHPQSGMTLGHSSLLILGKVFPLLLLPLLTAILIRHIFPSVHSRLLRYADLSFYLWAIALSLAIAVTTRSIVHCTLDLSTQLWLVVVSLICCALQFGLGRYIGRRYDDQITAGQSLGQKNTVLAIWIGYTFFTPITSIIGGFYSIWHNIVNSWQLYAHKKQEQHIKSAP